jgi:hypothetical protein
MSELVDTFLAITGSTDPTTAQNFLEMSGNDLDVAISLFFEHGAGGGNAGGAGNSHSHVANDAFQDNHDDPFETDAQMAERLQNEAYKSQQGSAAPAVDEPRAPMEARHERLIGDDADLFSGLMGGTSGAAGAGGGAFGGFFNQGGSRGGHHEIFGNATRRGVFNQVDDDDNDGRIVELDSDSDGDDDDDNDESSGSAQRKLARIFRPPFDLIEKIDLNTARAKARKEARWVLVNIQDTSEFQCQVLNRDFWSNSSVKELVKEHFVFLQYHKDSRSGEQYTQFYPFDAFPHIAILDPITGERLKFWNKVPQVSNWISEVYDFLNEFSLDPGSVNPTVKHVKKVDLSTLSEEKQLEYAIQQSLDRKKKNQDNLDTDSNSNLDSDSDANFTDADDSLEILDGGGDEADPITLDSDDDEEGEDAVHNTQPRELTDSEKIKLINPLTSEEPTEGDVTRIQIRTGDGKRTVRKFHTNDDVRQLYGFVKAYLIEQGSVVTNPNDLNFILTSQRENLASKIGESIEAAGLKNASVLVEVINDDDDDE